MKAAAIRLVLVGAVGVVGGALEAFLDAQDDLDVAASVGQIADVHIAPIVGSVAVVLLIFDFLDQVPWSQLTAVRDRFPGAARMLLSRLDGTAGIEHALHEGVTAVVDVRAHPSIFLEAIRRAARREPVVLVASITAPPERRSSPEVSLTPRERQILEFVCAGMTSRQVASLLHVSVRTVSAHLQDAYRRLGVTSRVAAVEKARQEGIL